MERKIILASHHHMASGLKDTVEFLAGERTDVLALDAYVDGQPIVDQVHHLIDNLPEDTEVLIFTDLLSGSVNQQFFPYRNRLHTHIISGMNLPIVLAIVLGQSDQYYTQDQIHSIICEARSALVYVNDIPLEDDEEDE
jgi:PTS system, IIA component